MARRAIPERRGAFLLHLKVCWLSLDARIQRRVCTGGSRRGAGTRGRTEMTLRSNDFESFASASSAIPAYGSTQSKSSVRPLQVRLPVSGRDFGSLKV